MYIFMEKYLELVWINMVFAILRCLRCLSLLLVTLLIDGKWLDFLCSHVRQLSTVDITFSTIHLSSVHGSHCLIEVQRSLSGGRDIRLLIS